MTKKKFISDYTERFGFYMLEGYSDTVAVEKMLGEVYDKVKRPTEEEYLQYIQHIFPKIVETQSSDRVEDAIFVLINMIYKKYLSDSNGGERTKTVSDNKVGKYSIGL